jgi:hypothetical protein
MMEKIYREDPTLFKPLRLLINMVTFVVKMAGSVIKAIIFPESSLTPQQQPAHLAVEDTPPRPVAPLPLSCMREVEFSEEISPLPPTQEEGGRYFFVDDSSKAIFNARADNGYSM